MAKRLVKWSLDKSVLKLAKALEQKDAIAVIEAEFDLEELIENFLSLTDIQQQVFVYGIKQKLMDSGASDIGDGLTKIQSAKAKWQELLEGKWSGERVNATNAQENKKMLGEVKDLIKTFTLEGLLLKKALKPAEFSQEDAKKLQEFMEIAARS